MKGLLRQKYIFATFRYVISRFLRWKFNYSCERIFPQNKQYIVLANHTTDYDPLMVGLSFPKLLYYVASAHIFRWGFASSLIKFLVSPIPRLKGKTEVRTVIEIYKKLEKGENVCIFAEGNRAFTGETGLIPASIAKLIKKSGVALITYRIDGGYLSSPRWSKTLRKGKMSGRLVREYSSDEIQKMTVQELDEAIKKDIYVNAYEQQEKAPIAYHGKRLAEFLENALYLCPECEGISTLKSKDDTFSCKCGLEVGYTPFGHFVFEKGMGSRIFKNVLEWSEWQSKKISELAMKFKELSPDIPILTEKNQSLWQVDSNNKSRLKIKGILKLFNNRIGLYNQNGKQYTFYYNNISDMAIYSQMTLAFSTAEGNSYEIKSDFPRSAIKYLELYRIFKQTVKPV